MHLHGVPMDENDDKGRPPYPIVDQLSNDEVCDDDDDDDVQKNSHLQKVKIPQGGILQAMA